MSKHSKLDQFYTKSSIAEFVVGMIDCTPYDMVLEPSAGAGDFYKLLPKSTRYGIDLAPAHPDIIEQNFFDYKPDSVGNILTIGNPPFGKNSSLAVKFFNHAAQFSDCIAFILPRTFRKASIINKLDIRFHLKTEIILDPDGAFYLPTGEPYSVPSVFQIWEKKDIERENETIYQTHPDFEFLGTDSYEFSQVTIVVNIAGIYHGHRSKEVYIMPDEELQQIKDLRKKYPKLFSNHQFSKAKKNLTWLREPDFAWRRAGGRAGEIFDNYQDQPIEGFEFIKINNPIAKRIFIELWNSVWNPDNNNEKKEEKWDTAGQPSISKHELIKAYIKAKEAHEP